MNRLAKAAAYALRHADQPLTVDDLAKHAGISKRHFCRRFKDAVGLPPGEYITKARLYRAKLLLSKGTMPIKAIALECGFASQSSFTTAFKVMNQVTPAAFRAKFRTPTRMPCLCEACPYSGPPPDSLAVRSSSASH